MAVLVMEEAVATAVEETVVLDTEEAVVVLDTEEAAVTEEVVLETEGVDTRGDVRVIAVDFIHPLHQNGPLV